MVTNLDRMAALAGFGLLIYGIGRLSIEAALITSGVLLLASALWHRGSAKREEDSANE